MSRSVAAALFVALAAACAPTHTGGAERITLADGSSALSWGSGEYGVVLVADESEQPEDWAPLAADIAANRMTVVAPEPDGTGIDRLTDAAAWLTDAGMERIAYLVSGPSGAGLLAAYARAGGAVDQLIVISGTMTDAELADLGEPPKLFVAAEGDGDAAAEAERLTDGAAGTWNALLLVPGSGRGADILAGGGADELISGVVARLEERR